MDPSPDLHGGQEMEPPSLEGNDGSGTSFRSSATSNPGEDPNQLLVVIRAALARIGLDDMTAARPAGNPFFHWARAATPFEVPPSTAFLEEL